jgi:metal-responsive CopG/Arc/MetJ family transcriptional regulator
MKNSERRVRVTVTLSPKVAKLVNERARARPDKSRSAAIDQMLADSELDRQVREYYLNETAEERDETALWAAAREVSAALVRRSANAPQKRGRNR